VTLKWTKPSSNGADITQYTVYIRNVTSSDTVGDWRKLEVIYDVSIHAYVVALKTGQRYDLVVTATNKYGESLKEKNNIKRIRVLGGTIIIKLFNYNHGQKSWDKFALLAILRTLQTLIQLHLPNLAPHPPYNVEN